MGALRLSPWTMVATRVVNPSGGGTFAGTNAVNPECRGAALKLEQHQ